MKLLIVDDQSTVVQGLLHCTNWAAMGFTVVDTALNAVSSNMHRRHCGWAVLTISCSPPLTSRWWMQ